MAKEIEYKFLLKDGMPKDVPSISCDVIVQGYVASENGNTVRVRITKSYNYARGFDGTTAHITIKGKQIGLTRDEFEYEIPESDAIELLSKCKGKVEKIRHFIEENGYTIELDEFRGFFDGLVIAEVEVESEDVKVTLPAYFGEVVDVSTDYRYTNASIVKYGIPRNEDV